MAAIFHLFMVYFNFLLDFAIIPRYTLMVINYNKRLRYAPGVERGILWVYYQSYLIMIRRPKRRAATLKEII